MFIAYGTLKFDYCFLSGLACRFSGLLKQIASSACDTSIRFLWGSIAVLAKSLLLSNVGSHDVSGFFGRSLVRGAVASHLLAATLGSSFRLALLRHVKIKLVLDLLELNLQ